MTIEAEALRARLEAKAREQIDYWRKRQAVEKALEDGVSEDGESYTPMGDHAAWQSGYCNGRMSEADWWMQTLTLEVASLIHHSALAEDTDRVAADGRWHITALDGGPHYNGEGEQWLQTWSGASSTYDLACIDDNCLVGEEINTLNMDAWRWLAPRPDVPNPLFRTPRTRDRITWFRVEENEDGSVRVFRAGQELSEDCGDEFVPRREYGRVLAALEGASARIEQFEQAQELVSSTNESMIRAAFALGVKSTKRPKRERRR